MDFNFREEMRNFVPAAMENKKICMYGMGVDWEYQRRLYRNFAKTELAHCADFLVDGSAAKQDTTIAGKKIHAPEEIPWDDCVVFITSHNRGSEIAMELIKRGFRSAYSYYGIYYLSRIFYDYIFRLSVALKGNHNKQRCFIIGNGPSLCAKDLNKLYKCGDVSFATNQIYKIFDKTAWRPSYYVLADGNAVKNYDMINQWDCAKFVNLSYAMTSENFAMDNVFYFMQNDMTWWLIRTAVPEVSTNIYNLDTGGTSTFTNIQLALYMGFSEIYLLGVDNIFNASKMNNGDLIRNEDIQNYFIDTNTYFSGATGLECFNEVYIEQVNLAYQSAADYAAKHNVIIKNASRAGKIDAFKYVDFDSLF